MKMTSVHCSKVATVYEEEKPPSRVKEMEREIIRYSSPASSHDTSLNGSLCPCNFLPSSGPGRGELPREIRISLPRPPDALPTSSSSFLSSSSSSSSVFLSLYRTKMFDKLDNCFLLSGGEESWSDKSNVGSKKEFCIDVVSDYLYNWMISIHVFNLFNNHDLEI